MTISRLAVIILVTLAVGMCSGQTETALLSGRITDPRGGTIPGAQIVVTNINTNVSVRGTTNQLGIYVIGSLPPGHYRVSVSREGFKTINLSDLTLTVQDTVSRNFELQVGSVSESVTVIASAADLRSAPAVSTVVDQKLVGELPLNGRSFQTLFQLTPGAVLTTTSNNDQGQFSVNGQRTNANYFMVDGASATASTVASFGSAQSFGGSLPPFSASGGTNSLVSTEAVQEFAIQTSSFAPEFGRTSGGQISIVTRSGTNKFHGKTFDYLRNDIFDAKDWFANHNDLPKAEERQNDFGGVFGGPLLTNKTFFFFSYEGLRLRQPTTGLGDVPSLASRTAAPTSMQPFFNAYPLPTGPDEGNGLAVADYAFSNPSTLDTASIRVDHHLTQSLSIFGRYNFSESNSNLRGDSLHSFNTVDSASLGLHTLTFGATYALRPTLIDEGRFNWTRASASGTFSIDQFGGATILPVQQNLPAGCRQCILAVLLFLDGKHEELESGQNVKNSQKQINFVDNVSWQSGKHLMKFGVDYRRLEPQFSPSSYLQEAVFSDIPTALTTQVTIGEIFAHEAASGSYYNWSLYGQDTWAATARLTLTYGLRWDYNSAPTVRGADGLRPTVVQGIADPANLTVAPAGTPFYSVPAHNFAPRLGFAYHLGGTRVNDGIIRGGVGIFYDLGTGPTGNLFQGAPFSTLNLLFGAPFPFSSSDAAALPISANPPFDVITAFRRNLKLPYTYQWNIAFEKALGLSQKVTISYIGALAHDLLRTSVYVPPAIPFDFEQVNYVDNSAYSNYNALQAQFRRSLTHGFNVLASYTFSHALDNSSSDSNGAIPVPGAFINPRTDYSSADFDIRHTGAFAFDYEIPNVRRGGRLNPLLKGWGVNSVATLRSSSPVNVTVSRDIGFGTYNFRPDLVAGESLYVNDKDLPGGRMINQAAVVVPTDTRQGDLGRNFFRGFSLVQVDIGIRRTIHFTERLALQARLDAFNVFNHPNFAPPQGDLGTVIPSGLLIPNPAFGVSQSNLAQSLGGSFGTGFNPLYQIGGPRSLQLALRLEF